ncbi:MAG: helix-turn-helix transcriptional regulator [Thermodesulfobacteria bacterium]|nr:helix-turn-helix transcriptional regulator [Thermodesulfobacteriota bacterium]
MNLKSYVYKAIFDSLDALIAVIDEEANIIATNKTWQQKAVENGLVERVDCIGYNYLKLCENTQGDERKTALEIAEGIKKVIKGRLKTFKRMYSFVDPGGRESYYLFSICEVEGVSPKMFVISHQEIAVRKEEKKRKGAKITAVTSKEKTGATKADVVYLVSYIKNTLEPLIESLKKEGITENSLKMLEVLEGKLNQLISATKQEVTNPFLNLTPKEAQIAILVKEGFSSKEIARLLNLSKDAIDFYRKRIRRKLGIKGKNITLKSFFEQLES